MIPDHRLWRPRTLPIGSNPPTGRTRTLRCRYTGQKLAGNFVRSDDADIDWEDNKCSVCGASGYEECTSETGDALGQWVHSAREGGE